MIQVAIVEDDQKYASELARLIAEQQDMKCLLNKTSIGDFYQALDLAVTPDILLLSQQLGAENSVLHLEKIYKLMPGIPIIIMAANEQPNLIHKSLLLGVSGYFSKREQTGQLLNAIHEIINGHAYLSPRVAKIAVDMIRGNKEEFNHEFQIDKIAKRLPWNASQREINVIHGLIDGRSYKEIAASNYMTIDGVRYYVRSIYPKLGVASRDQLVKKLTR